MGISGVSMRINGLNSGIDTESVVKALLSTDQNRIDNQSKQKQKLEWKLDSYRSIKTELKAFTQKYMSVLSSDNLWSSSALKLNKVSVDSSAVSISASSSAKTGAMIIDSITHLAAAATANGSAGIAKGEGISNPYVALKDLELNTALEFDADGNISFSINGKDFTFHEDTTLQTMMNTINKDKDANATLSYSQLTNSFTLESDTLGSASSLVVVNYSGNAFGDGTTTAGALGLDAGTYTNGRDALLSINNVEVTRSTNNFTIDGITYTLNKASTSPIEFTVAQDIDTAVNKIKTFIGEFNTLVSKYNGLVTEKTYKDFPPLTEEQRGEMTEDEIKKWEEKAKSGILRSDLDLTSMLSNFRLAFSTKVEGTGMSLMDIGLSTISYSSDGQIEVNETALRKALADDPDTVANLFTQSSSATGSAKFSESGLMQRLSSVINSYVNDIQSASVEMTEKRISEIENKMEELENVLASNQERYYARFTAMEEALSKLNSTSNWLSSLFSSTASES